ncbi:MULTISPECIES: hypothetical protein [unclassified Sphingomonas]|uniref:hypothetical protein n=1 Tax=Novosphingobium rhizosphaerae TaxID=1551649 RepID=UPI0015CC6B7A
MTKTFTITAGTIEVSYDAVDEASAINAYVQDAGYASVQAAADACNQTVENFLADITVTEV